MKKYLLSGLFNSAASSFPWVIFGLYEVRHGTAMLLICLLPTILEFQPIVPPPFHCPFFL